MMIRKCITLAVLGLIVLHAGAQVQNKFRQELAVGASFGTTFSRVSFAQTRVPQTMKMGYTGGLTLRWLTEKNLGLQAEVNFVQQGWNEKFEDQPQYYYKRTLNYVEVPILTHIYFGNKRVRFIFNLGPKVGWFLNESTEENLNGASPNTENTQHDMALERKFDWGLCGGPGLEIRTGIGSFLIEGRYYYALGDIFNSHNEDYFSKSSSQVISAKITYLLPIIK